MTFFFTECHLPGRLNGRADTLSRWPGYDQGENDNKDVVVLPDHVFVRGGTTQHAPPMRKIVVQEEMEAMDPVYAQNEELLKPWINTHRLKKIEGTWYKDGRRVVMGGMEHKQTFIQIHHNAPVYGHPGINKTYQLASCRYWWPNMQQDVNDYVRGCVECQRNKINTRPTRAPLSPIFPIREAMPFKTVALDFITKLPISQGYDSILTVTDHDCTKAAIFIPCKESMTAEETAGLIIQHIFLQFGLPLKFISDRDPRFASKFTRGLCKGTGTTQNISTAYHPQTDRQLERTNQWLEQYLRFWVNERQDVTYAPARDRQTAKRAGKSRAEEADEWIKSEDGITETMTGPNGVYTRFVSTSPPESEQDDAAAIGFMRSHD